MNENNENENDENANANENFDLVEINEEEETMRAGSSRKKHRRSRNKTIKSRTFKNKRNKKGGSQLGEKNISQYKKLGSSKLLQDFYREITIIFLENLLMVKLFHWKTTSYATHKATDDLYSKLNEHFDSFIEILLGKTGSRIELTDKKNIALLDFKSQEEFEKHIVKFKEYLFGLNDNKAMLIMVNSDLFNIRDAIVGDLNQLLYLLTFK
jgi:hypothetical protein